MSAFRTCFNWRATAVVIIALVMPGCGDGSRRADYRPVEVSGRVYQMPAQVLDAHPAIREAYLFALAHPEVLQYMPCYCGCEAIGHRGNLDCFIDGVRPDGTVQIDDMGFG